MALSAPAYRILCEDTQGSIVVDIAGQDGDSAFSQTDMDAAVNAMADYFDGLTDVTLVSVTRNAIVGTVI
jgi:hypothetical protein